MLTQLLTTNGDWTIAIVRIVLGVVFFAHGAHKVGWFGGAGLQSTVRGFREHLQIPAPLAVLTVAAEFLGGLGLIVGLLSRIAALGIAVIMCVAVFAVHRKFGFFMDWYGNQKGHGIEYHILVLALAMLVIFKGAGPLSVDRSLSRHLGTHEGVTAATIPDRGA